MRALIAGMAIALMPAAATAAEYHFAYLDGGSVTLVDVTTFRPAGASTFSPTRNIRAWLTVIHREPQVTDDLRVKYAMIQTEIDCESETERSIHIAGYDTQGNSLYSQPIHEAAQPVIPGTNAETVFNLVCRNLRRAHPMADWSRLENDAFWTSVNFDRLEIDATAPRAP